MLGEAAGLFLADFGSVPGDVVFAFESAVNETGQGVEEAEAVEGAGLHGFFKAFRPEIDNGLAHLGDGDLGQPGSWQGLRRCGRGRG
jgi:hypothetical protein